MRFGGRDNLLVYSIQMNKYSKNDETRKSPLDKYDIYTFC